MIGLTEFRSEAIKAADNRGAGPRRSTARDGAQSANRAIRAGTDASCKARDQHKTHLPHLKQWNFMTTAPVELAAVYRPSKVDRRKGGRNETRGANRKERGGRAGSAGRSCSGRLIAAEGRQIGIEKQLVRARATQSSSTLRHRITSE